MIEKSLQRSHPIYGAEAKRSHSPQRFATEPELARLLRLIGIVILASVGAALAAAAFFIVKAGWFADEPSFRLAGEQTFTCYLDRELRYSTLSIGFSENRKRAVIHFPERDATTIFHRGGLAGDVFCGDGVKLVVDPEAYVTGYRNLSIGPCQRD